MATLTVDPYANTINAFTEILWRETVAGFRTGGENVFNKRSGEAALTGMVPSINRKAAMRFFLGYEQVQGVFPSPGTATPYPAAPGPYLILARRNPIRHPDYENLWCTACSEQEFDPPAQNAGASSQLKVPTTPVRANTPPALGNRAGYNNTRLLLRFSPVPYNVVEDTAPFGLQPLAPSNQEFLRNCAVDFQPEPTTFEPKLQYTFVEGTGFPLGGFGPGTSPLGTKPIAERATILVKSDVTITWSDVPRFWLTGGSSAIFPANILAALGTVNAFPFLDFPPGTLLFMGAKLDRYPWALRAPISLDPAGTESDFLYTAQLHFQFFNPSKGFDFDAVTGKPVRITTNLGHNNFPFQGSLVSPDVNGGLWFLATTDGQANGPTLFGTSIFSNIFNCPANPQLTV